MAMVSFSASSFVSKSIYLSSLTQIWLWCSNWYGMKLLWRYGLTHRDFYRVNREERWILIWEKMAGTLPSLLFNDNENVLVCECNEKLTINRFRMSKYKHNLNQCTSVRCSTHETIKSCLCPKNQTISRDVQCTYQTYKRTRYVEADKYPAKRNSTFKLQL